VNPGAALARRWLALPPRRCAARHSVEWVPVADGVRLATSLWLPSDGASAWPGVLLRTSVPAHRPAFPAAQLGRLLAESGQAVVVQECRGRYASEGVFAPWISEAADGGDAIAWIARQPWFDGRLALVGWGYSGYAAWAALSRSPLRVAALVAAFAARDPYALVRPGGALALELALRWGVGVGEREHTDPRRLALERGLRHRPLREADRVTSQRVDWFREWIDHPQRDAWWEARTPALPGAAPPTLLVSGWRNPTLPAQLADFEALDQQARRQGAPAPELVVGPWPGGRLPTRAARRTHSEPRAESLRVAIDFLARAFRGGPVGGARVFVSGAALWHRAPRWPLPEVQTAAYYLRGEGRANGCTGDGSLAREPASGAEPADEFTYDPRDPVPSDAAGVAAFRDDMLWYATQPLPQPLSIGGRVRVVLFVASSAAVTDFTATLFALDARGAPFALCEGVLRSRGEPGAIRRLEIELGAAGIRLDAGQRLSLAVSSSAFPRWDRPSHSNVEPGRAAEPDVAPARQTLLHDALHPSQLVVSLLATGRGET
jgi:putative CocE/NonD family hydrolase